MELISDGEYTSIRFQASCSKGYPPAEYQVEELMLKTAQAQLNSCREQIKAKRGEIAKVDYEFGSPKAYFDWEKLSGKDKEWYLRKADALIALFEEVK